MDVIAIFLSWILDSIEVISLLIIVWCITRQSVGEDGFYAAHIIFAIYILNVWVGSTEVGAAIEENSYFFLQTLYALGVITLLRIRINKLSACLMALYTGYIFVHMFGWWLEVLESYSLYFYTMLALFGVEVALLLSERVVNGFYRGLASISLLRLSPDDSYTSDSSIKGKV